MNRRRATTILTEGVGGKRRGAGSAPPDRRRHGGGGRQRDEEGNAVLEFVILTPPILFLLALLIGAARVSNAHQVVDDAAGDAARAGSATRSVAAARVAADLAATTSMSGRGVSCTEMAVTLDASNWRPGGVVAVSLSCTVVLSDLGLPLGGNRVITATAASVIDRYRQVGQ